MRLSVRLLTTLIALLLAPTCVAGQQPTRPIAAVELQHLEFQPGEKFQLYARYSSCVGRLVVLFDSDARFELANEDITYTLRDPDLDRAFLLWDVEYQGVKESTRQYALLGASKTVGLSEWYETYRSSLNSLAFDRFVAVSEWIMSNAAEQMETDTLSQALSQMLEFVLQTARAKGARDLRWLQAGEKHLQEDDQWLQFVAEFIDSIEITPELGKSLQSLGFVKLSAGWFREQKVLDEIGMVRDDDGEVRTVSQSLLREAVAAWNGNKRDVELLRGYTKQQYEEIARDKRIKKGMERRDLAIAWGYPLEVTWFRQNDLFYEAWLYPDRQAFLVDGRTFDWNTAR